jgi:DnaJ-class molecular chaperone
MDTIERAAELLRERFQPDWQCYTDKPATESSTNVVELDDEGCRFIRALTFGEICEALADADLLADTTCHSCSGTGGTDLGGARCAVCDGTGHRRAER